jgi:hypothetical protein
LDFKGIKPKNLIKVKNSGAWCLESQSIMGAERE